MRTRAPISADEAVALYRSGLSLAEIGQRFGCHAQTVANRMRDAGVERRSVSESLMGREIAWASKIGDAHRGKKHTEERRRKISEAAKRRTPWNKGKRKATHPELANVGNSGESHWAWKGGISTENVRFRQSSEYKAWRDAVFVRDHFTCVDCGKVGGELNADHVKPFSTHPDLRLDVSNGQTRCEPCHKQRTAAQWKNGDLR